MHGDTATREVDFDVLVDQETVDRWADLSEDFNPLHVDPRFAAGTPFGSTIAHGHLGLALLTSWLEASSGAPLGLGARLDDVRFLAPMVVGTTHRVSVSRDGADSSGGGPVVVTISDPDGRVCVRAEVQAGSEAGPLTAPVVADGGDGTIGRAAAPLLREGRTVLYSDELEVGHVFRPAEVRVDARLVDRYAALVPRPDGVMADDRLPAGLAAVIARWAYLQDHTMPPGSVLLRMDVEHHGVAWVGQDVIARARVDSLEVRETSTRVGIVCEIGTSDDQVSTVSLLLRWAARDHA